MVASTNKSLLYGPSKGAGRVKYLLRLGRDSSVRLREVAGRGSIRLWQMLNVIRGQGDLGFIRSVLSFTPWPASALRSEVARGEWCLQTKRSGPNLWHIVITRSTITIIYYAYSQYEGFGV